MYIDVLEIGNRMVSEHKKENNYYESLEDYTEIAKKIISIEAPKIRSNLAEEMLANDDAISNIAHSIMKADWDFDGRGSKHGFRKSRAIFAIKSYVTRSSRNATKNVLSLDYSPQNDSGEKSDNLLSNIPDGTDTPYEILEKQEIDDICVKELWAIVDSRLSKRASQCIRAKYIDGKSNPEIAAIFGVTRQTVHDTIKRAEKKLAKIVGNDNFFRGIMSDE